LFDVAFKIEGSDGPLERRLGLSSLLEGVLLDQELEEVELINGPTLRNHILDVPDSDLPPSSCLHRWEQGKCVEVSVVLER
jgi:hypothetical protein